MLIALLGIVAAAALAAAVVLITAVAMLYTGLRLVLLLAAYPFTRRGR